MDKNKCWDELLFTLTKGLSDEELLMTSIQSDIAAEIASARITKGLSQKELADALGVSQALVSRWENGDSNFTLQTLVRIALKLDIEMKSPYLPTCHSMYSSNMKVVDFSARQRYYTTSSKESHSSIYHVKTSSGLMEM
nr:helix-turn-helix transcriptional regulator [uncultured Oscillibacter sp.]